MSATTVNAFEFCRLGEERSGVTPVESLGRLSSEAADAAGELRWSFAGGHHPKGFPQLTMTVDGYVSLICQRCLAPFRYPVSSETVLALARDEADADAVEDKLDDDSIDVIVGSTTQDLQQLIEDEALLSLPLSARHEVCPGDAPEIVQDKPDSPFAVLKKLN